MYYFYRQVDIELLDMLIINLLRDSIESDLKFKMASINLTVDATIKTNMIFLSKI